MKTLGTGSVRKILLVVLLAVVPSFAMALTLVNNNDGLNLEYTVTQTSTNPPLFKCEAWSGAGSSVVTVWEDYTPSAKQDWVFEKLTHGWEEA